MVRAGIRALGRLREEAGFQALVQWLDNLMWARNAADALGDFGDRRAVSALLAAYPRYAKLLDGTDPPNVPGDDKMGFPSEDRMLETPCSIAYALCRLPLDDPEDRVALRRIAPLVMANLPGDHDTFMLAFDHSFHSVRHIARDALRSRGITRRRSRAAAGCAAEPSSRPSGQPTSQELEGIVFIKGSNAIPNVLNTVQQADNWRVTYVVTDSGPAYRPGRNLYVLRPPRPDGEVTPLTSFADGYVAEPELAWDANHVVFTRRGQEDPWWHVYRVGVDGSGLVQLTGGPYHDVGPAYLPDGRIVFSRLEVFYSRNKTELTLHAMHPDGTQDVVLYGPERRAFWTRQYQEGPRGPGEVGNVPLTHRVLRITQPQPMPDGRILCASTLKEHDREKVDLGLYVFDPASGRLELIYNDPKEAEFEPRPILPRRPPTVQPTKTDPGAYSGRFLCSSVFATQEKDVPIVLRRGARRPPAAFPGARQRPPGGGQPAHVDLSASWGDEGVRRLSRASAHDDPG